MPSVPAVCKLLKQQQSQQLRFRQSHGSLQLEEILFYCSNTNYQTLYIKNEWGWEKTSLK